MKTIKRVAGTVAAGAAVALCFLYTHAANFETQPPEITGSFYSLAS
ncbi:MAG: hypothetical protein MUF81_18655 [Verrucomicrobia bacterium]|nr:hypothetical protein [Verrucomicrobiota bacterium]